MAGDSQNITGRPWGNVASYTDAEWHDIWRTLFDGSGDRGPLMLSTDDDFEVTQTTPAGMTIQVATGTAIVGGLWGQSEETVTLTVAANGGGANRYDLVFLHWQRGDQDLRVRIVDGTAATCALAVAPATNAIGSYQTAGPPMTQWAVPLACITVVPAAAQILDANITDMREFCQFRTAAGDIADGTTVTTQVVAGLTPAMTDAGAELVLAADGVGVDEINSEIAGDGLTGGSGSALDVVPGTGLELVGDALQIAASAAGDGLSGGAGAALDVNVDAATIVIAADTLSVGTVDDSHISNRTRYVWIGANEMYLQSGGGATWGSIGAHPVPAEGWIFPQAVNEYVIAHIQFPQDMANYAISATLRFVWAHALAGGGPFTTWWHFLYNPSTAGAPYRGYYRCADPMTGTPNQGWAKATNEVSVATADLRKCTDSGEAIIWLTDVEAGNYLDLQIGRNGASPSDDYLGDVVLLGVRFQYTADM